MNLCSTLKTEYESLEALKQEFVSACVQASASGGGSFDTLTKQDLKSLQRKKQALEKSRDALKNKLFVSPEAAKEIMGKGSYFGPEAVQITFGVELNTKDLPRIPWSVQELKEAKARGEMLILRIDKDANGNPLTAKAMDDHCQPLLDEAGKGIILTNRKTRNSFYVDDPIYTEETCRSGWVLVSKKLLPTTLGKDYVEQTHAIVDYITAVILNNQHTTFKERKEYQDAINQWNLYIQDNFVNQKVWEIRSALGGTDKMEYMRQLTDLSITQLVRQSFVEAYSDILTVALNAADQHLLEDMDAWTSSLSRHGFLVTFGHSYDDPGSVANEWDADDNPDGFGVLLARRGPAVVTASAGRPGVSRPS